MLLHQVLSMILAIPATQQALPRWQPHERLESRTRAMLPQLRRVYLLCGQRHPKTERRLPTNLIVDQVAEAYPKLKGLHLVGRSSLG